MSTTTIRTRVISTQTSTHVEYAYINYGSIDSEKHCSANDNGLFRNQHCNPMENIQYHSRKITSQIAAHFITLSLFRFIFATVP